MFDVKRVKNYRQFGELLEKETGCDIKIQLMSDDGSHTHYQFDDRFGMTLGVLCVDEGYASFAQFETLDSSEDNQYINISHLAQFNDFMNLLSTLGNIFVEDENK